MKEYAMREALSMITSPLRWLLMFVAETLEGTALFLVGVAHGQASHLLRCQEDCPCATDGREDKS